MLILTIVGISVGVLVAAYYGRRHSLLLRRQRTLTWAELQAAAQELAKDIKREGFNPDILFALSSRSAIVAHLILLQLGETRPLYVGIQADRRAPFSIVPDAHTPVETSKWITYVPDALFKNNDKAVLVVDDAAMSGDSLSGVVEKLLDGGFDEEHVRTVTVLCTNTAIESEKAPDYHWLRTSDEHFFFPWGKAR